MENRLYGLIREMIEGRAVSRSKALAVLLLNTQTGNSLYVPFGLDRYNTVYRRAQRAARKNGLIIKISKNKERNGLNVVVVGTLEDEVRAVSE